jgi:hypothetical protein
LDSESRLLYSGMNHDGILIDAIVIRSIA